MAVARASTLGVHHLRMHSGFALQSGFTAVSGTRGIPVKGLRWPQRACPPRSLRGGRGLRSGAAAAHNKRGWAPFSSGSGSVMLGAVFCSQARSSAAAAVAHRPCTALVATMATAGEGRPLEERTQRREPTPGESGGRRPKVFLVAFFIHFTNTSARGFWNVSSGANRQMI